MHSARKLRIETSFGEAARAYDRHALVQAMTAAHLADIAARHRLTGGGRILEIGCGTGLLTREIRARWPAAWLIATDLSPQMLDRAAKRGAADQLLVMDGEAPVFEGRWFDLILSSLAVQWFDDLPLALARLSGLLRPGGSLYFSTMGAESFGSWHAAHAACNLAPAQPPYPTLAELAAMLAPFGDAFVCDEHYPCPAHGGAELIHHFRAIGAGVPRPDYRPLPPAALRRVIAAYDAAGGQTQYHVLFGRISHAA